MLEGVMMRGTSSVAIAVRDESGQIRLDTKRLKNKAKGVRRIPFVRGVFNFFDSMILGVSTITKAAEVLGADEAEKQPSQAAMKFMMGLSVFFGVALSVLLFIFLPNVLTGLLLRLLPDGIRPIWKNLMEGCLRLLIFVSYLLLISLFKEIHRTFMYHGAEHKTINCYESELPLTVENVRKCSTFHDRCGTSFLLFVMVLSVLLFSLTGWNDNVLIRLAIRLAMLPLVAGVSYELLKFLASHKAGIFAPLRAMGKWMQKISVKEPTDDMIEVAITSFEAVLKMDADPTIPEQDFPKAKTTEELRAEWVPKLLAAGQEEASFDWLLCEELQKKRSALSGVVVGFGHQLRLQQKLQRLCDGEPLQYVMGTANFFGYEFDVTPAVLIPRPETELLTEQAIRLTKSHNRVLDLCCGSGCIGITVQLKTHAEVVCADVSADALEVCRKNAEKLRASVTAVQSDLWQNVEGTFDVIVSNPPYIPSRAVEELEAVVQREPRLALDGGADGLDFYRAIAAGAADRLNEGGWLLLEVGIGEASAVCELLQSSFETQVKQDYNGIDRMILAQKRVEYAK